MSNWQRHSTAMITVIIVGRTQNLAESRGIVLSIPLLATPLNGVDHCRDPVVITCPQPRPQYVRRLFTGSSLSLDQRRWRIWNGLGLAARTVCKILLWSDTYSKENIHSINRQTMQGIRLWIIEVSCSLMTLCNLYRSFQLLKTYLSSVSRKMLRIRLVHFITTIGS